MANRQESASFREKSEKRVPEGESDGSTAQLDRETRLEEARMSALESLDLLDTPESESFDRIPGWPASSFEPLSRQFR